MNSQEHFLAEVNKYHVANAFLDRGPQELFRLPVERESHIYTCECLRLRAIAEEKLALEAIVQERTMSANEAHKREELAVQDKNRVWPCDSYGFVVALLKVL